MPPAVDRIEVLPIQIPLDRGHLRSAILVLHRGSVQGLGEAPALPERGGSLADICAELTRGRPRSAAARAAWSSALLDLQARERGLCVAELLGGVRRRQVRCSHLVRAQSPAQVGAEVASARGAGFETFKLKALDRGGALDQERLAAAREAGGPGAQLRLDMNQSGPELSPAALARFRLEFIEQPLPATAPLSAWLQMGPGTGADESLADLDLGRALGAAGVVLAIKLATVGGARPALGLARVAAGPVLLGSSLETSVGLAAALQVACALPREPRACGLATASLLEVDPGVGLGPPGPLMSLPDSPGLGVELDRDALRRYRVEP
ncbi:MAG TPA: mandelate racemase/muconate lactonizing enzyme family protein [Candidatus Nitrosotalea sp.]|nr:mandelate racemase/muconate lactonizing enzyme family protein [Candidatus Nitrosotalea sp.]